MAPAGGWVTRAADRLEVSHGAGWPMLQLSGAELRRRREQLGLTIEQVSVGTGLTRDALAALEGDQSHRLTRGAYGDANGASAMVVSMHGVERIGVPALRGVAATAPYLHDGSAETLRDVLERSRDGSMGDTSSLDEREMKALEAWVKHFGR